MACTRVSYVSASLIHDLSSACPSEVETPDLGHLCPFPPGSHASSQQARSPVPLIASTLGQESKRSRQGCAPSPPEIASIACRLFSSSSAWCFTRYIHTCRRVENLRLARACPGHTHEPWRTLRRASPPRRRHTESRPRSPVCRTPRRGSAEGYSWRAPGWAGLSLHGLLLRAPSRSTPLWCRNHTHEKT